MILSNRPLLLGTSCIRQFNSHYRLQHVYAACAPGVQSQVSASAPQKPVVSSVVNAVVCILHSAGELF